MLVLSRKSQEKIHIGDNVTITIVRIQGSTVRVGIEAPHNVRVIRGEISPNEPAVAIEPESSLVDSSIGDAGQAEVHQESTECLPSRTLAGRVRLRTGNRKKSRIEGAPLNAI
jgi:carbon storage regulator CsrA